MIHSYLFQHIANSKYQKIYFCWTFIFIVFQNLSKSQSHWIWKEIFVFIKFNFLNNKGIFFTTWLTGCTLFVTIIIHSIKQLQLLFTILIIKVWLAL